MKFITFGSIKHLKNIIKDLRRELPSYPTIKGIASEKIHGTNASVCLNKNDFWVQSRKNIITEEKDNAECAKYAFNNKENWKTIIKDLVSYHKINLDQYTVTVYFEWCGGNIQKKSAVSSLDKRAIIFQHFKISNDEEEKWLETKTEKWVDNVENNIFNIMNFPHWEVNINLKDPQSTLDYLNELVDELEKESLVGLNMGVENNIGEGVVVTTMVNDKLFRFKVKGKAFTKTKVKVKFKKNHDEFVIEHLCTAARLEQMWQELFGIQNEKLDPDIKYTGEFLKLVNKDIIKEELETISEHNLEIKDLYSSIARIAREWFFKELDEY